MNKKKRQHHKLKTHYQKLSNRNVLIPLCGVENYAGEYITAENFDDVTCGNCRRTYYREAVRPRAIEETI